MPWWQHIPSRSQSDDNIVGARQKLKTAIFSRRRDRQIGQGRKIRNPNENEIENSPTRTSPAYGTPPYGTPPSPHPLPVPALQVLLRRNDNSPPNNNLPLPSPKDAVALLPDVNGGNWNGPGSRLSTSEARRSTDQPETRLTKRPDNVIHNAPFSAPASPYSTSTTPGQHISHGDTSTNQHVTPPASLNVWSARDLPPADSTPGSSNQTLIEKTVFYIDNSLLESPRISPGRKSTCGSASPLPNKLPAESSTTRRESNSQSNVHPLPLPPLATTSQPAPITHLAPIPEVVPVNSQWQKGKLIGRGTFGSVYVASNRETGALCAMKEVELLPDDPKSAESIKQLEQEINVLSNLKHPNIVQYYGSEIVGDRFYIYLEYVHPGSLTKFIKDHCGAMTESVVRNFTRHILSGLAYLHSTKTIHRDIKGANLLVDAYGVVKLADFGMAKHLNEHRANLSLKGSPYWMAPELLQSVMETDATVGVALTADIWSLGCTIIEMLNGRPPWSEYEGAAALFKVQKENPQLPENLSEEARDFLQCCFRRNPAERPTATMLLEHRFVKGASQTDVPSTSGTKSGENGPTRKERSSAKVDQIPVTLDIKGKQADNFTNCSSPVSLANNVMSRHLI